MHIVVKYRTRKSTTYEATGCGPPYEKVRDKGQHHVHLSVRGVPPAGYGHNRGLAWLGDSSKRWIFI